MEVLYISYDGMTDNLGQSQVIPYLMGLSKKGFSFTLISCEKEINFIERKDYIQPLLSDNNIDWHPIQYTKKPPVLSTVYDIFKLRSKAKALHKSKDFKIVHCRSYIPSIIGLGLKKKYCVKFIFDMRGFWADERVDGKLWNLKNILFKSVYNYFKKLEIDFLNYSDAIVSLTHAGKQEMKTWNGLSEKNKSISVIPCSADFDLFYEITPEVKSKAKTSLGIDAKSFVLTYLGSIGTWYMLDEMLDFFIALKKEIPRAKFLFITGESREYILEKATNKNISTVDFIIRKANRNEVPNYLAASDWGISFIKPSYSKISSSPTKMGEMLAMGIPLICNEGVGDVKQIIQETHSGFTFNNFNEICYNEIIQKMKNFKTNEHTIRTAAYEIYSLEKAVEAYYKVYQQILK